jgi:hypothetical protein
MSSKRREWWTCCGPTGCLLACALAHNVTPHNREQMYKKRFTAWGLFKNRTQRRIAQLGSQREAGPDPIGLRGRDHDTSALLAAPRAYLNRPLPSEIALHSINSWANGIFDSTRWQWINQRSKGSGANAPVTYPSTRLYQDFALARALLVRGEGSLAGMAIRKGFWHLEDVVRGGDPAILRNLVDIFYQDFHLGEVPLINMLLYQLACLATRGLPSLHPLVQFFQQMSKMAEGDMTKIPELLRRTWRCFVETFHRRMDHSFYWMYENWAWETSVRTIDTDPEQDYGRIMEALQALALRTEDVESSAVSRSHLELLKYTKMMKSDGFYKTSAATILKALEGDVSTAMMYYPTIQMGGYVETYLKSAMVKHAMDEADWGSAEAIMRADIQKLEIVHGVASREVIRQLWSLEKVMRRAGDHEGASIVANDATKRAREYLSDVQSYL